MPDKFAETKLSSRVKVKSGVVLFGVEPIMIWAANTISLVYRDTFNADCWITCGRDGNHMKNSKHFSGFALDFRTRIIPRSKHTALRAIISDVLGPNYDCVKHVTHLHVEYDPKS